MGKDRSAYDISSELDAVNSASEPLSEMLGLRLRRRGLRETEEVYDSARLRICV
jgi:hypothetical protein